jgi:hypothetical protein
MAVRDDFTAGEVLAAADLNDTFAAKLNLAGGKILQIVRATDTSNFNTTSTSLVDVTGMSVTITPQRSTSALIIITTFRQDQGSGGADGRSVLQITDSSNNQISGAQEHVSGVIANMASNFAICIIAYATPATTSPVTYKLRARTTNASSALNILNASATGQLFAIEVSA